MIFEKLKYQDFIKNVQWEASCSMRTHDRQTGRKDELYIRFSQICERA